MQCKISFVHSVCSLSYHSYSTVSFVLASFCPSSALRIHPASVLVKRQYQWHPPSNQRLDGRPLRSAGFSTHEACHGFCSPHIIYALSCIYFVTQIITTILSHPLPRILLRILCCHEARQEQPPQELGTELQVELLQGLPSGGVEDML